MDATKFQIERNYYINEFLCYMQNIGEGFVIYEQSLLSKYPNGKTSRTRQTFYQRIVCG